MATWTTERALRSLFAQSVCLFRPSRWYVDVLVEGSEAVDGEEGYACSIMLRAVFITSGVGLLAIEQTMFGCLVVSPCFAWCGPRKQSWCIQYRHRAQRLPQVRVFDEQSYEGWWGA